jgi:hypothetical protein
MHVPFAVRAQAGLHNLVNKARSAARAPPQVMTPHSIARTPLRASETPPDFVMSAL